MKKELLATIVVYAIMIGLALYVGLEIINPAFSTLGIVGIDQFAYAIATIILAFLINVVILELGHVVGAIIGGNDIKSVNVLGLAIFPSKKGWRVVFEGFEGLTGETVITPKHPKSKNIFFLLGGLFFYFVEVLVGFFVGYYFYTEDEWGRYASIIIIAIGGMLMIYNYMPFQMDTVTDGYRLTTSSKTSSNEAHNELLRIENAYRDNIDPQSFQSFKELNSLTMRILMYDLYDGLFKEDYTRVQKLVQRTQAHPTMNDLYASRLMVIEAYMKFSQSTDKDAASYFYSFPSKDRKYLTNNSAALTISAYLHVAGLIEDSYSETLFCVERMPGALAKVKEPGRKHIEEQLYLRVYNKVKQKHPDWDL
jgi:hypothetical protein